MTALRTTIVAVVLVLAQPAFGAAIRHVPGTYATIQAAIDSSHSGDTVLVDPGTYPENINFHGKGITVASQYLLSRNPADIVATIIDGSHSSDPDTGSVVLFISGEDTSAVLEGFTITGGTGTGWKDEHSAGTYREGGGILTAFTSPTIRHNYIVGNDASNSAGYTSAGGGAIRSGDGNPRILSNVIASNRGRYGAGIVLNFCSATVRNNLIYGNSGGQDFGGSGIWINGASSGAKLLENNTIVDNTVTGNAGGGLSIQSASVTARNNIIWHNAASTDPQISVAASNFTITTSDIQGGWFGSGNINLDPLFSDSSHRLLPGSPCIDAGNAGGGFNDPEDSTLAGMARFPSLGTTRNDIGAYGGPLAWLAPFYDAHVSDPLPPSGATAYSDFQTPASITLHWTDPVSRRNGAALGNFKIQLFRDSVLISVVDSGIGTYLDGGLTTHERYHYRLRTVMPNDTSTFDSASAYAGGSAVPMPVSAFTTRDGTAGVRLLWRNPSRQTDGTPLNDLAFILLYRDDVLFDSVSQASADTGGIRTYDDTAQGYHAYRVEVRDNEVPLHTSASSPSSTGYGGLTGLYRDSFESGLGRILKTGTWDTTAVLASDSNHSLTDSPGAAYPVNTTTFVLFPPAILGAAPMLRFDHIAIVRPGSYAILDVSRDQRQSFLAIRQYDWSTHASWQDGTADSNDWVTELINFSAYAGDTVTVRLRLITGGPQSADGWYIDNLYLGPADIPDTVSTVAVERWNLVSLPLLPSTRRRDSLYPGSAAAFRYQNGYVATDSLVPGTGYWLRFGAAETSRMAGATLASDTIPVVGGWNLVGSITAPLDTDRAVTIPAGIRASSFFGFDSHYVQVPTLQPGHGYWVRASEAGKLVLSVFTPPSASPAKAAAPLPSTVVTVTDARGRSQQLTLAEAGSTDAAPPLPPPEIFDIRFAGDRYNAVATGGARFALQLQAVAFPLLIAWTGDGRGASRWSVASGGAEQALTEARELVIGAPGDVAFVHADSHRDNVPGAYRLMQNTPNPFNPRTLLHYELPARSKVSLEIFTALGQKVATLVDEDEDEGEHDVAWNARDARGREMSSGVYFYRLDARPLQAPGSAFSEVKRMMLLR